MFIKNSFSEEASEPEEQENPIESGNELPFVPAQ